MHHTNIKKSSLAYATTKKKELTVYDFLLPTADKPTALQELIRLPQRNRALYLQK